MNKDQLARQRRRLTRWAEQADEVGVGAVRQIQEGQIPGAVPGLKPDQRTIPNGQRTHTLKLLARNAGTLTLDSVRQMAEYPQLWATLGGREMTTTLTSSVAQCCWEPIEQLFQKGQGEQEIVVAGIRGLRACMNQSSWWLQPTREQQIKRWIEKHRPLDETPREGLQELGAEGLWRHLAWQIEWEAQECYRLYRQWENRPGAQLEVCRLAREIEEDMKFWNVVLSEQSLPEQIRQFGQKQPAVHQLMTEPAHRKRMFKGAGEQLLAAMLEHSQGEEFRKLFIQLCQQNPTQAWWCLTEHPEIARKALRPQDLTTLTQHENPDFRHQAIRWAGQLDQHETPKNRRAEQGQR